MYLYVSLRIYCTDLHVTLNLCPSVIYHNMQLAEIIGFDRLDLVQLLLKHRTAIVVSFMEDNDTGAQSKLQIYM